MLKGSIVIDKLTFLILEKINNNPTCSISSLGEDLRVSRFTIKYRERQLKNKGYIIHYKKGYVKNLTTKGYELLNLYSSESSRT